MSKSRKGFTLIEVALFLVITGALFASVVIGVQNSIYQQRFNDSVQSYVEFLRRVYSGVTNVENIGSGRSTYAIYGKLVTFNSANDSGDALENPEKGTNVIHVYNVVGRISDIGTGNVLDTLKALNADVVISDGDLPHTAGIIESFIPKWASRIETPCNGNVCDNLPFKGALLIVRHPSSGTVHTFVMKNQDIDVDSKIEDVEDAYQIAVSERDSATTQEEKDAAENRITEITNRKLDNILAPYLNSSSFKIEAVDFCIDPEGDLVNNNRRDVRIVADAQNGSGIEILNDENNNCRPRE